MAGCNRLVLSLGVISSVCLVTAQTLSPEAQLVRARSTWVAARPASYEFTLRFQGNYPPPFPHAVVFRVLDGRSTWITAVDDGWTFFEPLDTIDKLLIFLDGKL
jgi:hypothetical protein